MNTRRIWPPEPDPSQQQPADAASPASPRDPGPLSFEQKITNVLKQIYDPEIPINIVDLGLIYHIDITPSQLQPGMTDVHVTMTLTTPNCPEAESIPQRVRQAIQKLPEAGYVEVDLVWTPPWDPSKMTEDARLILGLP